MRDVRLAGVHAVSQPLPSRVLLWLQGVEDRESMTFRKSGRIKGLKAWCTGVALAPLAVLGLAAPASAGTPGQIDPGFEAPAVNERILSVAVQPNGKILIGGVFSYCLGSFSYPPCPEGTQRGSVARLNVDGKFDETFSPPPLFRQVQAIAIQPDGKVLIGGNVTGAGRDALIRLDADGSIDEGFFDPDLWRPDAPNTGTVESIALQSNGKIIIGGNFTKVGGESGESRDRVARLNADGTIDFGFGSPVPNSGPNGAVNSLALQPDGKVLVGGAFTSLGEVARERAARLGDSGTLDELFVNPLIANATGAVGTPIVESIVPQPDGKVLIGGGFTRVGGQADPENVRGGAARLEADGTLDEDFDNPYFGGVVNSVVLQRDGEIPLGGAFSDPEPGRGKHLARLKADGTLDTSFTSPFSTDLMSVDSLALQPDGKLVFSVLDQSSSSTVYEVARVLNTSPQAAPTSVSATAGNGQATVAWAAVPGEIAEYSVTASSGGHSCDTTSETSCTLTGLSNGTPYTFTVKAANEFGDGPASSSSNSVTPTAPAPDPPTPDPPGPEPGPPGPTPDPPGPEPDPTPSPSVSVSEVKAKVTKKAISVTSRVKVSGAGKIAQRATTGKGSKARTWCRASRNVSAAGTYTITCNLGKKGRKALRKGILRFTLRTTFTPTTGEAVTRDRNLTLKRKR